MGPVPFPYWLADEYGIEPSKSKKKSDILKDKEMKQWHTSLVSISSEIIVYLWQVKSDIMHWILTYLEDAMSL